MSLSFCSESISWLPGLSLATTVTESPDEDSSTDEDIEQIIKSAQQGDSQSFESLISRYLPFISREIIKLCPYQSMEDIAQEVLIRTFRALPRYTHSGSFRWWLKKIISRTCLDFWRYTRKSERIIKELSTNQEDKEQSSENDRIILADLERFLSILSADNRIVFILAFLEDRSHHEIAELLGISLTATKVRCFRLKKYAKEHFYL